MVLHLLGVFQNLGTMDVHTVLTEGSFAGPASMGEFEGSGKRLLELCTLISTTQLYVLLFYMAIRGGLC